MTFSASMASPSKKHRGSLMTDWKAVTSVKSATAEVAALLRSIDFGVKTTSGRFMVPSAYGGAAGGSSSPGSTAARRSWNLPRTAAGNARYEPRSGPGPFPHSRAAAAGPAGGLAPLGLTGGDVLVNGGLRAVGEVAELCLPEYGGIGVTQGVAVFKAHAGVLGEGGVVDDEACRRPCPGASTLRWRLNSSPVARVEQDVGVALGERATAEIFAGEAHESVPELARGGAEGDEARASPSRCRLR